MESQELWKVIQEYPIYEVSTLGRVRNTLSRKILKPSKVSCGHLTVKLSNGLVRTHRRLQVHVLVLLCFVGPRPLHEVAHHKDCNPENNRLENLVYVSRSSNSLAALTSAVNVRLNEQAVKVIKWFLRNRPGVSVATLAKAYKISPMTVYGIKAGNSWAWVTI